MRAVCMGENAWLTWGWRVWRRECRPPAIDVEEAEETSLSVGEGSRSSSPAS